MTDGTTVRALTRLELLQMHLTAKAIAGAAEAELKRRATDLFATERSADTWRLAGAGQVITAQEHDRVEVVDLEALGRWLLSHFPHQVREVRRLEIINTAWLSDVFLAELMPLDGEKAEAGDEAPVMTAEGTIVPGVVWRKGGGLHGVSIRPDSGVMRAVRRAAEAYIAGTGALPGLPNPRREIDG